MEHNIFEVPSSQVSDPVRSHADRREHINYTFYAFVFSPLVTIFLAIFLSVVFVSGLVLVYDMTGFGEFYSDLKSALSEGFLVAVSFLYFALFIFGLSTHWLLGKISRRKLYLYLLVPAFFTSPTLLMGIDAIGLWAILSGILAVPFGIFWILAVYLPRKRTL